jgi:hypothetical protein
VSNSDYLTEMYIHQSLLTHQQKLMYDLLTMAGSVWEISQKKALARGGRRRFRLCELQKGTVFWEFEASMRKLWHDASHWTILSPTPRAVSRVFRAWSRACATNYELLICRFRRWPFRLFKMAEESENPDPTLDEFEDERECTLDMYCMALRRHFLRKYGTVRHRFLMAEVQTVAEDADPFTVSTERFNASFRRRLKRRAQTRKASLSCEGAYQALRGRSSTYLEMTRHLNDANRSLGRKRRGEDSLDDGSRKRRVVERSSGAKQGVVLKRPAGCQVDRIADGQRSGGGGRHRAAFKMIAASGQVDHLRRDKTQWLKEVHRLARDLPVESLELASKAGKIMTVAHRLRGGPQPRFRPKPEGLLALLRLANGAHAVSTQVADSSGSCPLIQQLHGLAPASSDLALPFQSRDHISEEVIGARRSRRAAAQRETDECVAACKEPRF